MKFTVKTLGICAALAGALGASMPAVAATTLRIGTVLSPNDPMGQGLEKFKLDVEKATNGDVVIEVFHNSQLGDTTEMIDQARAGAGIGTVTDVARLSSFVPSLAIMSAPFLFDTYEQADKFALSDEYIAWGDELREKSGLVMSGLKPSVRWGQSQPRLHGAKFIPRCSLVRLMPPKPSRLQSGMPSFMKSSSM